MNDDFAKYIEPVAAAFGLTLNKRMSRKGDQRYGSNGSLSIDLEKGRWYDHEQKIGGGVLDLVHRLGDVPKDECAAWMREKGILDEVPQSRRQEQSVQDRMIEDAVYDYTDESGALLYQVVRYVFERPDGSPVLDPKTGKRKKTFRQRCRDDDGWRWSVKGSRLVPYRLSDLQEAIADERAIFLVEGERKADALLEWGVPATCFAMGAGKWQPHYAEFFRGAHIVLMADNDDVGRKHMADVGRGLKSTALSLRTLELPGLPDKGDIIEWIAAGGSSAALYKLVEMQAQPFEAAPFVSKFGAVIWGKPINNPVRYEFLIKGLIPRKESILVYGASQSGKSFLTQDICMAIAIGGDKDGKYCGRKVRRGGVIYAAAEGGVGFIDHRFTSYSKGKQVSLEKELPFICFTKKFDLFGDEPQLNDLIAEGKYWKSYFAEQGIELELFVIDTLNKVTPAMDEISGKDVGIVMKRLDRIKEELGCGLILVHHKNGAGTAPRGHTSLYAAFETAIEVGLTGEIEPCQEIDGRGNAYTIAREKRFSLLQKQREGEAGRRFCFVLRGIDIDQDEDGEWRTSCVVEWIDKDQSVAGRRAQAAAAKEEKLQTERMTEQRRAIFKALRKAIEEYGVVPPATLGLPKTIVRVVDKENWAKVWASQTMEKSPDTARKALARANLWLLNAGYIGRDGDWAWVTDKGLTGKNGKKPAPTPEGNVYDIRSGQQVDPTAMTDGDCQNLDDAIFGSNDDQTVH